jgi:hypothetical protein
VVVVVVVVGGGDGGVLGAGGGRHLGASSSGRRLQPEIARPTKELQIARRRLATTEAALGSWGKYAPVPATEPPSSWTSTIRIRAARRPGTCAMPNRWP